MILDVLLHGRKVGQFTDLTGDRNIFTFDEAYLTDPNRPLLGLGFKGAQGGVAYTPKPRQTQIEPYFSNLLPEGRLREYVAERDNVHPEREFHLIRLLGGDLPGAVIVRPQGEGPGEPTTDGPLIDANGAEGPLKFSLAGVQMKLSAVKAADGGLTIPASGAGGGWIVKFPSERFQHVPQNEFWMMTFAQRIGLESPDIDLVSPASIEGMPSGLRTDQGPALAVRRFDRDGVNRVHMEDFAQIFRIYPRRKYTRANFEMIGRVIWQEMGEAGLAEFVARLVFTAAIGNGDMHAKNWSVLHPLGGPPRLAPIYDYVSTLTYMDGENLGLNLAGSPDFRQVSRESLEAFAKQIGAPVAFTFDAAEIASDRILEAWPSVRADADLPGPILSAIEAQLDRVPILRSTRPSAVRSRAAFRNHLRSASERVALIADQFDASLPADLLEPKDAISATFAFTLEGGAGLPGLQARGWSWNQVEQQQDEIRRQLRRLAIDATVDAAAKGRSSGLRPAFRPMRGPETAPDRLPSDRGPLIGQVGGRGAPDARWWLSASGDGAALRLYPLSTNGEGPVVDPETLVEDLLSFLTFLEGFSAEFPGAEGAAVTLRWRKLWGVRLRNSTHAATETARSISFPVTIDGLSRSNRPRTAAALLRHLFEGFGVSLDTPAIQAIARG